MVTLTTAMPVGEDVKNAVILKIKQVSKMKEIELESVVDENIIGGFILEADGRRVDASIAYDLANIKKQFQITISYTGSVKGHHLKRIYGRY